MTLYVLVFGHLPFEANNLKQLFEQIGNLSFDNHDSGTASEGGSRSRREISPAVKEILRGLLERDPAKRISLAEVCSHEWVVAATAHNTDADSSSSGGA